MLLKNSMIVEATRPPRTSSLRGTEQLEFGIETLSTYSHVSLTRVVAQLLRTSQVFTQGELPAHLAKVSDVDD